MSDSAHISCLRCFLLLIETLCYGATQSSPHEAVVFPWLRPHISNTFSGHNTGRVTTNGFEWLHRNRNVWQAGWDSLCKHTSQQNPDTTELWERLTIPQKVDRRKKREGPSVLQMLVCVELQQYHCSQADATLVVYQRSNGEIDQRVIRRSPCSNSISSHGLRFLQFLHGHEVFFAAWYCTSSYVMYDIIAPVFQVAC